MGALTRVRIVRATVAASRVVSVGEVLLLPADEAALLLRLGRAVAVAEDAPAVEPAALVVQHQPTPKRRTR